jgi:hypothetical protein
MTLKKRVPLRVISGSLLTIITTEGLGRNRGCVASAVSWGGSVAQLLTQVVKGCFGLVANSLELSGRGWRLWRCASARAGGRQRMQSDFADIEAFLEAVKLEKIK